MSGTKYAWTAMNNHGEQRLGIESVDRACEEGINAKLVLLKQRAGSMSFQFSMTPAQAREMAMALIAAAEALA